MDLVREQIVTNGCSGGCCENFTLPYYLDDLKLMLTARTDGKDIFFDTLGNERKVYSDTGLAIMIDMLIPLGHCGEYNLNMRPEEAGQTISEYLAQDGIVTQEDWNKRESERKHWYVLVDGKWTMRNFTCRHFDTTNRVCTNYENRPPMCSHFGETCHYKGCSYTETLKQLQAAEYELRQKQYIQQLRDAGCTCQEPTDFTHEDGCKLKVIDLKTLDNDNTEKESRSVHG